MNSVYKDGTSIDYILFDGWSRNFTYQQTLEEVLAHGGQITLEEVIDAFDKHQRKMEAHFQRND